MVGAHIFLAVIWIIFSVLHSLLASLSLKKKAALLLGASFKYYRLFYTLFAFAILGAVAYYQIRLASPFLYNPTTATSVIGGAVALTGGIIMGICIKKYFISLSGLKSLFQELPFNQLMIQGIHRYVRHPLYLGTFIFIWGFFIAWPQLSLLIANFIITTYTLIGIELEEQKLKAEFGKAYQDYQQQVPKLLPFRNLSSFRTVQRRKEGIHRF